jgi:alkylation response protein AidB-like acyl-CoA dehydrogenase
MGYPQRPAATLPAMATTLFSAEHEALRESVRRWVEREVAPRVATWEEASAYPREVLAQAGAQGWHALALPGEHGGDPIAALVVAEELGRTRSGGLVNDLLAQAHAAATLASVPSSAAKELAEPALSGTRVVGLVGGDFEVAPAGDGWRVTGRAAAVANAQWADAGVVIAPGGDGLRLLLVDAAAPGWQAVPPPAPYGRRAGQAADVVLDMTLGSDALLADGPAALALMLDRQARWRIDSAGAAVAAAWQAWEDAKAYALQREAFGRPISQFQVNRHSLAEAGAWLTAARAAVHDAAHRLAAGTLEPGETAALKLYANRVANDVADRCLQLHGGYGYTMEYDVQRAWRDARHLRLDEAADEGLREEIALAMEERISG